MKMRARRETIGLTGSLSLGTILFLIHSKVAFSQQQPLTWHDVTQACSDYLMTVTAPPGFSPEEVLKTILENPKLPAHIRTPFVELAKAKAPYLLSEQQNRQ